MQVTYRCMQVTGLESQILSRMRNRILILYMPRQHPSYCVILISLKEVTSSEACLNLLNTSITNSRRNSNSLKITVYSQALSAV